MPYTAFRDGRPPGCRHWSFTVRHYLGSTSSGGNRFLPGLCTMANDGFAASGSGRVLYPYFHAASRIATAGTLSALMSPCCSICSAGGHDADWNPNGLTVCTSLRVLIPGTDAVDSALGRRVLPLSTGIPTTPRNYFPLLSKSRRPSHHGDNTSR